MTRTDKLTALINCLAAVSRNLEALLQFVTDESSDKHEPDERQCTESVKFNISQSVKRKKETKEKPPHTPLLKKEKKESGLGVCCRRPNETPSALQQQDMQARALALQEQVRPYVQQYGCDMCNAFYAYWSEPNHTGSRMRFEMERTWDTARRLAYWARRSREMQRHARGVDTHPFNSNAQQAEAMQREQLRRDNERRRLDDMLQAVPPWALGELKERNLLKQGMDAKDIIATLTQLEVMRKLKPETTALLQQWTQRRQHLLKKSEAQNE